MLAEAADAAARAQAENDAMLESTKQALRTESSIEVASMSEAIADLRAEAVAASEEAQRELEAQVEAAAASAAATAAAEAQDAARNPLVRQLSETAFFAEPFPCEAPGCEKFHSNAHGYCDAHAKGSLGFAGLVYRKVVVKLTVVLVAVVMGLLETKSKHEAAIFCAASATVVQINLILEAGRDGDPLPCLFAVLFALLFEYPLIARKSLAGEAPKQDQAPQPTPF